MAAFLVVVALERLRDPAARLGHEAPHAFGELRSAPGRQRLGDRLVAAVEVEQVDPIPWRRLARRVGSQVRLERRPLAGADRSGREDVEAGCPALEREADRGEGTGLADRTRERLDVGRGLEAEARRLEPPAQLVRLDSSGIHRQAP
jgi:hypothetical protein